VTVYDRDRDGIPIDIVFELTESLNRIESVISGEISVGEPFHDVVPDVSDSNTPYKLTPGRLLGSLIVYEEDRV
jgi:hypothetical protein